VALHISLEVIAPAVTARKLQMPVLDSTWSVAIRTFNSAGSLPSPLHGAYCVKLPNSHQLFSLSPALSAGRPFVTAKMPPVAAMMTYLESG
jgi:hypothetical protein